MPPLLASNVAEPRRSRSEQRLLAVFSDRTGGAVHETSSSRAFLHYWNEHRGARPRPSASTSIRRHPPRTQRHLHAGRRFHRSSCASASPAPASARCSRREIKGEAFTSLWNEASREAVEAWSPSSPTNTSACRRPHRPHRRRRRVDLELMLLPLAHSGHARIRAIGVLVPLVPPYSARRKAAGTTSPRHAAPCRPDSDRLEGRRFTWRRRNSRTSCASRVRSCPRLAGRAAVRHGFVVYSGGRETPSGEKPANGPLILRP